MHSPELLRGLHGGLLNMLKPLTTLIALSLLASTGCAEDFIEPDCSGELNTVVKGAVRGLEVDIESREVVGAVLFSRFYLAFPAPESAAPENQGNWLIDFGRNPLGGVSSSQTLRGSLNDWQSQQGGPLPFWLTSRDQGVDCDVRRGNLCGGFGADPDGTGELEREQSNNVERYHRFVEGDEGTGAGHIAFEELSSEVWKATFDVDIDADEYEPTTLGGNLKGCFYALLVQKGDRHQFAAPTSK